MIPILQALPMSDNAAPTPTLDDDTRPARPARSWRRLRAARRLYGRRVALA